jgi:AraC-like DNA-binding protein
MPRPSPAESYRTFGNLNQFALSVPLGSFKGEIIGWGFIEPRWWRNYLHSHSFYEVCFAFEGEGVFRINGADHKIKRGNVFIAKPQEQHEIISGTRRPMGICFWSFSFVPAGRRTPATAPIDDLIDAFAVSKQPVSASSPAIERTCQLLAMEVAQRQPGYPIVIEGLVAKLLLDTARAVAPTIAAENAEDLARSTDRIVQTAARYLRDNLSRPVGVRDVAAQVHLSERHLSRLFLKSHGKTILDYLTALRIDLAKKMLLNPDRPIKQIAAAVGYPDVHYFTTLFGRQTGQTPAAFRAGGGTTFFSQKRHEQST